MKRDRFITLLEHKILILDGAYGSEFFKSNFAHLPGDILNLREPDTVLKLQKRYVDAGCDILLTNTFNANPLKLKRLGIEEYFEDINRSSVVIARKAGGKKVLVFGDISSTGDFVSPLGKNNFVDVVSNFAMQAEILKESGIDGFIIETMSDLKELKAAILGIRSVANDVPLIAQMTFDANGRSVTGTTPRIFATVMNDLNVDVVGVNCSTGPADMLRTVEIIRDNTNKYISVEPNAGSPHYEGKNVLYDITPEEFADYAMKFASKGAHIIGGCCGSTPYHINEMAKSLKNIPPHRSPKTIKQVLCSRTMLCEPEPFMIIGERINPASKQKLQKEIIKKEFTNVIKQASKQQEEGSTILDVNLGIEKLLEVEHFRSVMLQMDRQSSLPLSLDIQTYGFLEVAMREYPGRALLNSARVTPKSIERKAALLNKHGGMLILLAMDKKLPKTAADRVKLIVEGISELEAKGIGRDRIYADALVLSFGAGNDPNITLETIEKLNDQGIKTVIGLSNLSFGLPDRSLLNGAFLSQAICKGLKAAIMNSGDEFVMKSLYGGLGLRGKSLSVKIENISDDMILKAILTGNKDDLMDQVESLLKVQDPLYISQEILGKAMEEVGKLFSKGNIYLPQLLLGAETVQPIFDYINEKYPHRRAYKGNVLLATVEGDIHDIGKKIIGTVLRSNGFEIVDIGADISADEIVKSVQHFQPDILGLSAMMTTTVDQIGIVSALLHRNKMNVMTIAGGASVNEELAQKYKIDGYCKNAASVVDLCQKLLGKN